MKINNIKYLIHFMRPCSGISPHNNPNSKHTHNKSSAWTNGSWMVWWNLRKPPSINQAKTNTVNETGLNGLYQNPTQIRSNANLINSSLPIKLDGIKPINPFFFIVCVFNPGLLKRSVWCHWTIFSQSMESYWEILRIFDVAWKPNHLIPCLHFQFTSTDKKHQ